MKYVARMILVVTSLLVCRPVLAVADPPSQQKILIGILPEMNVFKQRQRFKLLGEYLSKKTGVTVDFTILSRYGNIIERFASGNMDGAFFGSFTGALAIRKLGVVPLVRPVHADNTSTYRGYLFVRKDSGIRKVKDMKGKRMAFVEKATTAGYIFPLAYLRENGITDPEHFFKEYFFTGSHDAAISAVLNREADIGAAKNTVYDRIRKEDPRVDGELSVLAVSPAVPSNGLCVRPGLDDGLKKKLKDALLQLDADPEGAAVLKQFGAVKFIATTARDYDPAFELAGKAGIDMKNYVYSNK